MRVAALDEPSAKEAPAKLNRSKEYKTRRQEALIMIFPQIILLPLVGYRVSSAWLKCAVTLHQASDQYSGRRGSSTADTTRASNLGARVLTYRGRRYTYMRMFESGCCTAILEATLEGSPLAASNMNV